MKFDIITIFPEIIDFYLKHSILDKAQKKGIVKIASHNLRDFAKDKPFGSAQGRHKQVDDKPFGGGRGMIFKVEPLFKAVSTLKKLKIKNEKLKTKRKVVLFTPRGRKFTQKMATNWAKLDQLVLIAGRYEGVDERIYKYVVDAKVSIGDYVLMGGELPVLAAIEAVARLLPGVVGNSESLIAERITKTKGFVEYPQYTRPEVITINGKKRSVPKVLLSGDHKKIEQWRAKHSKIIE